MGREFKLPDLGEGIAEVELRDWLVKPGERIKEHQPIAEVETDKAVVQIPSPYEGTVLRLLCSAGELVRVGDPMLVIGEQSELPGERPKSVGIVGELPEAEEERPPLALPAVRKLARQLGMELSGVVGTGPKGSITREDLEQQASLRHKAPPGTANDVDRIPLRGVRRAIARNLLASQRSTAFVTCMDEADITDLWEIKEREQPQSESRGTHLTFLPFFIKAAQHALKEHPSLNASIDDDAEEIIIKREYHFGIAVDTPDGLIVPVIRNVGEKSIMELAAELHDLSARATDRTISPEELRGSSFTITNYGHFGGIFSTPIINWPDVAILGFGRIAERPWVHRGSIVIRRILPISLTFDHRVTDGADASRFLARLVSYLEDTGLLFIESR